MSERDHAGEVATGGVSGRRRRCMPRPPGTTRPSSRDRTANRPWEAGCNRSLAARTAVSAAWRRRTRTDSAQCSRSARRCNQQGRSRRSRWMLSCSPSPRSTTGHSSTPLWPARPRRRTKPGVGRRKGHRRNTGWLFAGCTGSQTASCRPVAQLPWRSRQREHLGLRRPRRSTRRCPAPRMARPTPRRLLLVLRRLPHLRTRPRRAARIRSPSQSDARDNRSTVLMAGREGVGRYSGTPPLQTRAERARPVRQSAINLHRDAQPNRAHNGSHEPHANRRLPPRQHRQTGRPRCQPRRSARQGRRLRRAVRPGARRGGRGRGGERQEGPPLDSPGGSRRGKGGEAEAFPRKLDRLTRSVRDLGELVERHFATGKAALLSVGEQIDTRSAAGRLSERARQREPVGAGGHRRANGRSDAAQGRPRRVLRKRLRLAGVSPRAA